MASSQSDLQAVQRLRFNVFNLELHEGLQSSYVDGLDVDPFDAICDHLVVQDASSGEVVGTYRMQTGVRASQALGYYCEQQFDFSVYEPYRHELMELGRACIAKTHRTMQVLSLLWRGIAEYAVRHRARYLFGCSSLSSLDPALGHAAYAVLQRHLAPAHLQTEPLESHRLAATSEPSKEVQIPKLLSTYLALGAWICSSPSIDRLFGTIDFLTCLDLQSPQWTLRRKRFLSVCD